MRAHRVKVGNVLGQNALKTCGAPNDDVVEARATDRASHSLDISILPR
jgi:hypothetical protein